MLLACQRQEMDWKTATIQNIAISMSSDKRQTLNTCLFIYFFFCCRLSLSSCYCLGLFKVYWPLTKIIECKTNPNCSQAYNSIWQTSLSVTQWSIRGLRTVISWLVNKTGWRIPAWSWTVKAWVFCNQTVKLQHCFILDVDCPQMELVWTRRKGYLKLSLRCKHIGWALKKELDKSWKRAITILSQVYMNSTLLKCLLPIIYICMWTQPTAENTRLPLTILLRASTVNAREMNKAKISSVDLDKK